MTALLPAVLLGVQLHVAPEPEPVAPPPRLVVLIVVDQCRPDYFERFAPRFEGFFARLRDEGRWFVEGEMRHAITVTASGHAAIGTGRFPSRNGIVGNEFFDAATRRLVGAANDERAKPVGGGTVGYSSARLLCDGLGDWWKQRWPQGRTIGISIKPRSAILPLGRRGDQAWWVDERTGSLVTSDAFLAALPPWAAEWNRRPPIADYPQSWDATLGGPEEYAELGCTGDDQAGEAPLGTNRSRTFPHSLAAEKTAARVGALLESPWGDALLLDFARAAIEGEQLGADDSPDLLLLGLSATDLIGHRSGPDSWEICEQILALDRTLADFFSSVEARIGADRVLVALTADHGVCPLPDVAKARGVAGELVDWSMLSPTVEAALREIAPAFADPIGVVLPISEFGIRLDRGRVAQAGMTVADAATALAAKLRATPPFVDARSHAELQGALAAGDRLGELLRNSSDGERAGDLLFTLPAGSIYLPPPLRVAQAAAVLATNHGSPHPCDTAVPIVLLGAGVAPGRISGRAFTVDLAPTLATAVGVTLPADLDGRPLKLTEK